MILTCLKLKEIPFRHFVSSFRFDFVSWFSSTRTHTAPWGGNRVVILKYEVMKWVFYSPFNLLSGQACWSKLYHLTCWEQERLFWSTRFYHRRSWGAFCWSLQGHLWYNLCRVMTKRLRLTSFSKFCMVMLVRDKDDLKLSFIVPLIFSWLRWGNMLTNGCFLILLHHVSRVLH
jgi:hypothetical protein